jgi:hypothetical protein
MKTDYNFLHPVIVRRHYRLNIPETTKIKKLKNIIRKVDFT